MRLESGVVSRHYARVLIVWVVVLLALYGIQQYFS
jgi:hypothetical protein